MTPRELIGTARAPGGVELKLFRHAGDYIIALEANELMSSRLGGSEAQLAVMTCERLREGIEPHLLIGGYGMGFTLRAALAVLGKGARVTVAELVPEIIEWARGPMAGMTAGCLDDLRVRLMIRDVAAEIAAAPKRYDAILLDVDNGPSGLVRAENDGLYSMKGLAKAKAALRPGGVLAIWSAGPEVGFSERLRAAGFEVALHRVASHAARTNERHFIWLGTNV
jgi:spermidine synthase